MYDDESYALNLSDLTGSEKIEENSSLNHICPHNKRHKAEKVKNYLLIHVVTYLHNMAVNVSANNCHSPNKTFTLQKKKT